MWSIPVPIPDNPLRYVLTYLIEHQSGFLMVDPGWDHPDSWPRSPRGWPRRGSRSGASPPWSSPTCTPTTTACPARCRRSPGAWIGMHEREDAWLGRVRPSRARCGRDWPSTCALRRAARRARGTAAGPPGAAAAGPPGDGAGRPAAGPRRPGRRAGLQLRARLDARALARAPVLPRPDHRLLLTGDHVLPRITPNVSATTRSPPARRLPGLAGATARDRRARCCPRTSTGSPTWTRGWTPWRAPP